MSRGVVFDYALFFLSQRRRGAERFVSRKDAKEQRRKDEERVKEIDYF